MIKLDPYYQVAGQVFYTNCAIEDGLSKVPSNRKLTISYEELCANPERIYDQIINLLGKNTYSMIDRYQGPSEFKSTNDFRLPKHTRDSINNAYNEFSLEMR